MLPWCKDERDEIVHTEYIRFLAQLDSKQRTKATKHAITAATSLLKIKRRGVAAGVTSIGGKIKYDSESRKRVAWHEQGN